MMDSMDLAALPIGGIRLPWLSRLARAEHELRDIAGRLCADRRRMTREVLDLVADIPDPQILELGAGNGGLSQLILDNHPTAQVTVTDVNPDAVARLAAEFAGEPRATVRRMDATAIDAPDAGYHLALFALSLHHLSTDAAVQVFTEGTRVADVLLILDLPRPPWYPAYRTLAARAEPDIVLTLRGGFLREQIVEARRGR